MCFDLGIVLVLGYAGDEGIETSEALFLTWRLPLGSRWAWPMCGLARRSDEGRDGRRTN
jgi:hypothetical protein